MNQYRNRSRYKTFKSPYIKVTATISKYFYDKLEKMKEEQGIPKTMLLARAIRNEFESAKPFDFPIELPHKYLTEEVIRESELMFKFICEYPTVSLENLIQMREDYGIKDQKRVAECYLYLIEHGKIEEYKPDVKNYDYPAGYFHVRPKDEFRKARHYKAMIEKGPLNDED